jgi:hypothetical protein
LEATPSDYSSYYFQQQQQIHSHSQPVAPIPNAKINHKALSEILEVLKKFQDEIEESRLAFKASLQEHQQKKNVEEKQGKTAQLLEAAPTVEEE